MQYLSLLSLIYSEICIFAIYDSFIYHIKMKRNLLTLFLGSFALLTSAQALPNDTLFDKDHTIDYLVVYDNSKKPNVEKAGGEEAFAKKVVESINLVLKNSNLDYRFRLAGTHHMDQTAPSIERGLDMVVYDEGVAEKRRACKADLVVLLTEPYGDPNSGLANQHAKHPDAYSCVMASMAANNYTAAHEAGHILGCYHARGEWEHSPSEHPWAAAFVAKEGYKTVMSTMSPGELVPIYSGPKSIWNNVVMGDENNDNVRMLKETLPKAVHFGDYLEPHRFFVSEDTLVFNYAQQPYEITVHSNSFFRVNTSTPWIKQISPNWGNVEQTVRFTIEANPTGKNRWGTIVIEGDAPDVSTTIEVFQSATGETTGISEMQAVPSTSDAIFNLSGKKVLKMQKGNIYIRNGKRVLKK